jgi:hypothetical protein
MTTQQVIDSYVAEVIRQVPARSRRDIGLELQGLLNEMLADRAEAQGRAADDATVLAMLREFGTPADIARRYQPPGLEFMPPQQTRSFALVSILGILVQWALTLPRVFDGTLSPAAWWLGLGLGAFWWPGFLAMGALLGAWMRHKGWFRTAWQPSLVDPDRVDRRTMGFVLFATAAASVCMASMPWTLATLPGPLAGVFAFDPGFLHDRAWPVLLLWAGTLATLAIVFVQGRWTPLARKLEIGFNAGFIALLGWWLAAGPMFQARATDEGARGAIALVMLFIAFELVVRIRRRRNALDTTFQPG